jgi:Protein of unknown function (DUF2917)
MNQPDNLHLDGDRFATLRGATHVHVTHGSLWLTVDGEPDDHIIECGQGVALPPGVRVLVQALRAPVRAVVLRPAGWRERARVALQGLAHPLSGATT